MSVYVLVSKTFLSGPYLGRMYSFLRLPLSAGSTCTLYNEGPHSLGVPKYPKCIYIYMLSIYGGVPGGGLN